MKGSMSFVILIVATYLGISQAIPQDYLQNGKVNKKTDIRNKNVNIIVNMDPKQVAAELWNVIMEHIGSKSPQEAARTVREIENVITPMVRPTRRGAAVPVSKVADNLEGIARRLLHKQRPNMDPVELEAKTKEVSSDLMNSLQTMKTGESVGTRRSMRKDREADKYVELPIRIKRSDLADALGDI